MRVLISGASVAGPVLAFWLARSGFRVTVVERAPALRKAGGHAVDLFRPAMDIVERMGLLARVEGRKTGTEQLTMLREGVQRPVEVEIGRMMRALSDRHAEIMRDDLAEIFHEATRESVEYVFGDSIAGMVQDASGVDVNFEHAAPRRFELVIGADGVIRFANPSALAIGGLGLVIRLAAGSDADLTARLMRYYWFRLGDGLLPVGTACAAAAWLGLRPGETPRRLPTAAAAGLAASVLIGISIYRVVVPYPRSEDQLSDPAAWRRACEWIRDNTPKDALVLAPRPHMTFKWFAERAEFATWKDVPQDAHSLVEWRRRHDELYGDLGSWVNYLPAARIRNVVEKYDVDYIVTYVDPPLEFEPVYRNNSFVVYRVAPR